MARQKINPQQLGTTVATLRTIATGQQATLIHIELFNSSTSAVTVKIYLTSSGGTAGAANQVLEYTLASKETRGFTWQQFLAAGDKIEASASVASAATAHLSVLEEAV